MWIQNHSAGVMDLGCKEVREINVHVPEFYMVYYRHTTINNQVYYTIFYSRKLGFECSPARNNVVWTRTFRGQ